MNQSETCYDSDLFESDQLEGLLCPIGLGVMRNPVFDQCGHVFCQCCISNWLKKSKLCPINKQPINEQQLIKAIPLKNMIDNLVLKQCLLNCNWKGKLDQYYTHNEKECPEATINCQNAKCEMQVQRKNFENHKNECQFRQIQCEYCQEKMTKSEQDPHNLVCVARMIKCEHCDLEIKFMDHENHVNVCPHKKTLCPIEGCNKQIKRNELEQHLQDISHIIILQEQIKQLKQEQKQIIPYLDGWRLTHAKKIESREWVSVNSLEKIKGPFILHFEAINISKRPNQWRAVIGISQDRLKNNHLWYRQKNSFSWIFGGFKCNNQAEVYGSEIKEENFKGKVIFTKQRELQFEYENNNFGTAYQISEEVAKDGLYLIISFVNLGKIRLLSLEQVA